MKLMPRVCKFDLEILSVKQHILFSIFFLMPLLPMASLAQDTSASLLEELDLNTSQRSAIQAILLGGMQSLKAINTELAQYDAEASFPLSDELVKMRQDLIYQRMQLAESMALEILDVLSVEQRSKLNFGSLVESLPAENVDRESSLRELEI